MNWQSFKSLYQLYDKGYTPLRSSLLKDGLFQFHLRQTNELIATRKEIILSQSSQIAGRDFKLTFERNYLEKFNKCLDFMESMSLNTPQCRFEVEDILILREMKLDMDSGDLKPIRDQIVQSDESRRGVSLMFFKNEKYLDNREALENVVKLILGIEKLADDRDSQYLYVLKGHTSKAIILCENLNFLKRDRNPIKNQIELWYAGGRNIEKLKYWDRKELPIYYSCDWDYDGLDIFQDVLKIIPEIKLLTPNGMPKSIVETDHKSLWRNKDNPDLLSGLDINLYTTTQKQMIVDLILKNLWIIEESNDLIKMYIEGSSTL